MSQNLVAVQAASGLLGCHVVKDLLDNGYRVRAIIRDRQNQEKLSMLCNIEKQYKDNLEIFEIKDLNSEQQFEQAYKDARFAVFSASPYRVDMTNTTQYMNDVVNSLRNTFKAIQKRGDQMKKIVYVSSVSTLADLDKLATEQKPTEQQLPINMESRNTNQSLQTEQPYDFVQMKALEEVRNWSKSLNNVPFVCLFAGFPVGTVLETSRKHGNILDWANLYFNNTFDAKKQRVYSYSDVQDVALAIRAVLHKEEIKSGSYIVADSNLTHPFQVYESIRQYKPDMLKWKPSDEERNRMMEQNKRLKQMRVFDTTRTEKDLGFKPHDAEKTLPMMMKSLIDQKLLPTSA